MSWKVSRRELFRLGIASGLVWGAGQLPSGLIPAEGAPEATTKISMRGWSFAADWFQKRVDDFEGENPSIKVDYQAIDSARYNERAASLFIAGTPPDVIWVRDDVLGAWVEAGYVASLEGRPGVDSLNRDMYPSVLAATKYKGVQYGLPFYSDVQVNMYNEDMIRKAGFSKPPHDLDDLKTQALKIKQERLVEFPLIIALKHVSGGNFSQWGYVFGQGGRLFDEDLRPLFPDTDRTALEVLNWWRAAYKDWKILSPASVEMTNFDQADAFIAGQSAFGTTIMAEFITKITNPEKSKVASVAKLVGWPGGKGAPRITRLYGVVKSSKAQDAAWRLVRYLGGTDGRGQFYVAKGLYLDYLLGYGYRRLANDPELISAERAKIGAGGRAVLIQQRSVGRARDNVTAPWFPEWDSFNQTLLQKAVLGIVSPRDALTQSARKAMELRGK